MFDFHRSDVRLLLVGLIRTGVKLRVHRRVRRGMRFSPVRV